VLCSETQSVSFLTNFFTLFREVKLQFCVFLIFGEKAGDRKIQGSELRNFDLSQCSCNGYRLVNVVRMVAKQYCSAFSSVLCTRVVYRVAARGRSIGRIQMKCTSLQDSTDTTVTCVMLSAVHVQRELILRIAFRSFWVILPLTAP
jgi:hypothetical protein